MGCVECVFSYLIGHDSLLGGVSSSPLLGTAGERFNNMTSSIKTEKRLLRC